MILSKKILILEDNLRVLSKILDRLATLEENQTYDLCIVTLSDYTQVQDFINSNPKADFDVILLDRDCKLGGSFHVLDIEKFGAGKVIAISSVPRWNEDAKKRGVKKIIEKDFLHLDEFTDKVVREVEKMIRQKPFIDIKSLLGK